MSAEKAEKPISKFVHLHTHSHYSMLDGMGKIPELVKKAADAGMPALALTDHGVMHGVVEFYEECEKVGIKPIIGCEVYVAPRTLNDKVPRVDASPYHLILLARNETGYKNLIKLTTVAHLEGYYYKPRVDKKLLRKHSEGLIACSACVQGEIPRKALEDIDKGREALRELIDIFGKENLYLEVQKHKKVEQQDEANRLIFKLADEFELKVVATNDIHYVNSDDAEAQDALICLQTSRYMDETDRMTMMGDDYSMLLEEQMAANFPDHPEVLTNTLEVAEKCNLKLELGGIIIPDFPVPKGHDLHSYFLQQSYKGLNMRYGSERITDREIPTEAEASAERLKVAPQVWERFQYEAGVIKKMGYEGYLLIVADFIVWSKENGVSVGPGRGSGAGSIILYALRITELNPLDYNLLFERFLNPDRISMPDIDTDFADSRRYKTIEYVTRKYGADHVAQIITFGTMAARMAVRDVGRVLSMSYNEVDTIAKLIPAGQTLEQALENIPELKELYNSDPKVKRCVGIAKRLEGVVRHASMHAAGVVISKEPMTEYCPLQAAAKGELSTVTQYSMNPIEKLGLLKFDFLGLANLSIIQDALRIIRKTREVELDIDHLPLDDKETYALLSRAETTGVFQLESDGMKRYLRELKPSVFDDIIAMVALYRPGPMQFIDSFIKRKYGREEITYLDPKMENSLKSTYGILVYQEQFMQISKDWCGFTGGQADTLRKAVGKKKIDLMRKVKVEFVEGAIKHGGSTKEIAEKFWTQLEEFANYCFNKSHAACYALIAYQTAYLKAHYTSEYMAALMTSEKDDLDKLAVCIQECEELKVKVLPPSVNESFVDFGVVKETKNIRFGLSAIKNVGVAVAEEIVEERKRGGHFKDIEDFLSRLGPKVINKKSLEAMSMAGALDDLGERAELVYNMEKMLAYASTMQKNKDSGQSSLFGEAEELKVTQIEFEAVPPAAKKQRLAWERELLGMYVSEHPLSGIGHLIEPHRTVTLNQIKESMEGEFVRVSGIFTSIQNILTRSNQKMGFARLEDLAGNIEVVVFPKTLDAYGYLLTPDKIAAVDGYINFKDGSPKILAEAIHEISEQLEIPDFEKRGKKKRWDPNSKSEYRNPKSESNSNYKNPNGRKEIYLNKMEPREIKPATLSVTIEKGSDKSIFAELKALFAEFPGQSPVVLHVPNNGHGMREIKTKSRVDICPLLKARLKEIVGENNIEVA